MRKKKAYSQIGIAKAAGGMRFRVGLRPRYDPSCSNLAALVGAACDVWLAKHGITWSNQYPTRKRDAQGT